MILAFGLVCACVLVIVLIVFLYNQLAQLRTMVQEGWHGIEVQLKRRTNLIPELMETVNDYLFNERDLLRQVIQLRDHSMRVHDMPQKQDVENALTGSLARLFAVVENYSDLEADPRFKALQHRLAEIENRIQLTRRYYNGAVRNLNVAVETFPGNIVARWFAFEPAPFFEILQPAEQPPPLIGQ